MICLIIVIHFINHINHTNFTVACGNEVTEKKQAKNASNKFDSLIMVSKVLGNLVEGNKLAKKLSIPK